MLVYTREPAEHSGSYTHVHICACICALDMRKHIYTYIHVYTYLHFVLSWHEDRLVCKQFHFCCCRPFSEVGWKEEGNWRNTRAAVEKEGAGEFVRAHGRVHVARIKKRGEGKKERKGREKSEGKVRGNRQMEFTYIMRFTRGRKTFVAEAEVGGHGLSPRGRERKKLNNVGTKCRQDSRR